MQRAAGFVLAGGRSSRMGQSKARLRAGSRFLVEIIAAAVTETIGDCVLIGDPKEFADLPLPCLPDLRPGLGPLGGLETALASGRGELNLVVSCDMPDITTGELSHLVSVASETRALCVVAKDAQGFRQPLCAVYRSEALAFIRKALDGGRLRLFDLVEELKAVDVAISSVLNNLNTPEQWAAWQAAHSA